MTRTQEEEKKALVHAIQEAWRAHPDEVREFGLRALEDKIVLDAAGWTVPIVSTIHTGSAVRLADVLRTLQDAIESESKLWITLYLDPFAQTTTNGAH